MIERLVLAIMREEAQRQLEDRADKDLVAVLYSIWLDIGLELSELLAQLREEEKNVSRKRNGPIQK